MDFKNEITLLGALGANGLPLMTNVKNSFRSGIECDITYNLGNGFKLVNSSVYNHALIEGDKVKYRPLYLPKFILNQGLRYVYKYIECGFDFKYHSESYINLANTHVTPSFTTLNSNINYVSRNFELGFNLINVTDVRYFTNGYVINNERYFFVNPPRSFYINLKVKI